MCSKYYKFALTCSRPRFELRLAVKIHVMDLLRKLVKSLGPGRIFLDKRPKLWNTDMRFGTWNVRSLYGAASLKTVSRELARYKLHLVGVQDVRWEGGGTEPAGEYTFFYGKGN
jgi:hypothetical protein